MQVKKGGHSSEFTVSIGSQFVTQVDQAAGVQVENSLSFELLLCSTGFLERMENGTWVLNVTQLCRVHFL